MYRKVIVGIDFNEGAEQVIARARAVTDRHGECHLVHVFEPLDSVYFGVVPYAPVIAGVDGFEEAARKELSRRLDELAAQEGIPESRRHFLVGTPANELQRLARDLQADLLVLGTHGRKGVRLLLGSTANAVLHGAGCDILAVRLREEPLPEEN